MRTKRIQMAATLIITLSGVEWKGLIDINVFLVVTIVFVCDHFFHINQFIRCQTHSLPNLSSSSALLPVCSSPILHLFMYMRRYIGWLKLGGRLTLDDLPHNAKCYCIPEVLHTSCPASQSSSRKLLSSALPPFGDKCRRKQSGWFNQLLERLVVTGIGDWGLTVPTETKRRNVGIKMEDIEFCSKMLSYPIWDGNKWAEVTFLI